MHLPYDSIWIDVADVNEFVKKVKEDFEQAIEIYVRTMKAYELPINAENLKFEYVAQNAEVSRFILSDDRK